MIRKYRFGNPLNTEAVVEEFPVEKGDIPRVEVKEGEKISFAMTKNAPVYGLGEQVRGINKRGWIYISNCTDDPNHREDTRSLYAAHNFLVFAEEEPFGIFLDNPGKVTFDIGYTQQDTAVITAESWDMDVYFVGGEDLKDIVRQFRHMIGRSYIPPKWAFGFGQSRWGYKSEDDVREVERRYRELGIPLDSIYLDIDYMERFKDFTLNNETFPNFPEFVKEMREKHIHLVPIIDAGVKIEEGYPVYEEGVENGYFCKDEDGKEFVAAVWPGRVHFPDMLNPEARRWFGLKYKFLLDQGIDGFWNDMNEPSIFYSEKRLEKVFEELESFRGKNQDLMTHFRFKGLVMELANNPEDYRSFYHNFNGEGKPVRHDKVHNLYGYNMTRAAGEAFEELEPDRRILMFSRSSYIGMHRYGGIWQGDNLSWWSHLLLNIKMMPSLNMCGFLYTGADLCGFGADTTEDLALRWMQFGVFTPLMRNHAALGTREQELYQFSNREACGKMVKIRYSLLPYLYSEYMKAALRDEMMFRPLAFDYPDDPYADQIEDQLMVGDSIMIAPVHEQNATGRYVYLPEDMMLVSMRSPEDYSVQVVEKGHHYVPVAIDELIFFILKNHVIPVAKSAKSVEEMDFEHLSLLGYVTDKAVYELYDDDGNSKDYENPEHYEKITVSGKGTIRQSGKMKKAFEKFDGIR
ncbi:MAG TPA: alpha-glucosidase [Candidatus Fusicatenibacter intestinigallinarum]|uniref:Alpha-glucosidase n=1 Tax=Candidatus Fusicatenibacter intestinigallinarum TaxID=2838598 RepID=A0A9D2NAE3_9FIRM|nr:alpha-glucosidase [Candidatus Fusicatenibacter intestinigallinarum]